MIKALNYLFVTCFGVGSIRFAPGTITSLITTIFLYSLFHIINLSNNTILVILLIVFIYSFYAVSEYIKNNENKDPKKLL
jgi:phosphatidylglycerophosphatase A